MASCIYAHFDPRYDSSSFKSHEDYCRAALGYIGASVDSEQRLKQHLKDAKPGENKHYHWLNSLLKLGLEPVQTIIEDELSVEQLSDREDHWIAHFMDMGCRLTNHRRRGGYAKVSKRKGRHDRLQSSDSQTLPTKETEKEILKTKNLQKLKKLKNEAEDWENTCDRSLRDISGMKTNVSASYRDNMGLPPIKDSKEYVSRMEDSAMALIKLKEAQLIHLKLYSLVELGEVTSEQEIKNLGLDEFGLFKDLHYMKNRMVYHNHHNAVSFTMTTYTQSDLELAIIKNDQITLDRIRENDVRQKAFWDDTNTLEKSKNLSEPEDLSTDRRQSFLNDVICREMTIMIANRAWTRHWQDVRKV